MFDPQKLQESKYYDGRLFDLDWDTFNDGMGLTPSQATTKKKWYDNMGYWARSIKSEGRFMFYILAKDVDSDMEKILAYERGERKTPPKIKASTPKKGFRYGVRKVPKKARK